mgnify:CR=1 FL=1
MNEAIKILSELYTKILNETWVDTHRKRDVLTGIKMSIVRLRVKRDDSDDRSLQDAGY